MVSLERESQNVDFVFVSPAARDVLVTSRLLAVKEIRRQLGNAKQPEVFDERFQHELDDRETDWTEAVDQVFADSEEMIAA